MEEKSGAVVAELSDELALVLALEKPLLLSSEGEEVDGAAVLSALAGSVNEGGW